MTKIPRYDQLPDLGVEVANLALMVPGPPLGTLTSWYRDGADVQRLLPVLPTYLGHANLDGTRI